MDVGMVKQSNNITEVMVVYWYAYSGWRSRRENPSKKSEREKDIQRERERGEFTLTTRKFASTSANAMRRYIP